jgi:hypothetical protein
MSPGFDKLGPDWLWQTAGKSFKKEVAGKIRKL